MIKIYDTAAGMWIEGPQIWLDSPDIFPHLSATDADGNGPDGPVEVEGDHLERLKLDELKQVAADHGVDIAGLRKKTEIVTAIEAYLEKTADPATPGETPDLVLDPGGSSTDDPAE